MAARCRACSPPPLEEDIDMHVIGAGLPRTGTLTQKLALEQLGVGPCYHWVNIIADLDEVEVWHRALDGEDVLGQIFAGYESTVDWPGGFVYRELAEAHPDAKVLLSVRDPETWEPSYRETIGSFSHGDTLIGHLSAARKEIDPRWRRYLELVDRMLWNERSPFGDGWEPEQMKQQMLAYNESVKAAIPPERLLVWEVSEGWEPLCEFLEVPVPSEPLPHANDRDTFVGRVADGAIDTLLAWREAKSSPAA
jgi:sulfotransferase family protein